MEENCIWQAHFGRKRTDPERLPLASIAPKIKLEAFQGRHKGGSS